MQKRRIYYLTGHFEAKARVCHESGLGFLEAALSVSEDGGLLLKSSLSLSDSEGEGDGGVRKKGEKTKRLIMHTQN